MVAFVVLYQFFHKPEIDADTLSHLAKEASADANQAQSQPFLPLTMFQQVGLLLLLMLIPVGLMILKNHSAAHHLSQRIQKHKDLIPANTKEPRSFSDQLLFQYPQLTPYELTLCEMIMDKLSSKQMAMQLNISAASVNTARYRLRKKLGLSPDQDLIGFLAQFKPWGPCLSFVY